MTRREDWLERLWASVEAEQGQPFAYGAHDCCLFVAGVVDAMTDSAILPALQAKYTDKPSALRFIAESGGFVEAVSSFLGQPEQGWPRRGDVALIETEDGPGVGVCVGSEIACAHDGIAYQPAKQTTVWRVG